MMDIKELGKALKQVAEDKGLEAEKVLEAIESAIAAAYKKEYAERGAIVKAKLDLKSGDMKFWQVKTVVDETTARFIEEEAALGEGEAGPGKISGREKTAAEAEGKEKTAKGKVSREAQPAQPAQFAQQLQPEELKLPRYNPDRHILL